MELKKYIYCAIDFKALTHAEQLISKIKNHIGGIKIGLEFFLSNGPEGVIALKKYNLPIIEDACQSILGTYKKKISGSFGTTGAFSFHPLKNINVWSDAGMIVTNNKSVYRRLKLCFIAISWYYSQTAPSAP